MAEKEPMIVIKKINVVAAGGHGGAWKVAFADFMTAMMAFFLVMWLLSQSEEVKKNVSDYFSTPSIIEYNFSNYGVELTLEKLFLDLVNEPLKFFQAFITPTDYTPNMMTMGTKKIVQFHIADKMGDVAKNVQVTKDEILFEIPAGKLFIPGTSTPRKKEFVKIMDQLKTLTMGLEESNIYIDSILYGTSVPDGKVSTANAVADKRLEYISNYIESSLEHETVNVYGKREVSKTKNGESRHVKTQGMIRFKIKQNELDKDGDKQRTLSDGFGEKDESMDVYDNFVKQISEKRVE